MDRVFIFLGVVALVSLAEVIWPRRKPSLSRRARWPGAMGLLVISAVLARLVLPAGLAGLALWADAAGFGLFNWTEVPFWLVLLISLISLDFAVWAQHVLFHRVDFFWRFHRVHHTDPDFDFTTTLRFHPGEILISLVWKGAMVVLLGVPALVALVFEILLSSSALFNHANFKLPKAVDKYLRWVIVTPDMHRVHHSTDAVEHNRNFGFCLPWWDRLFSLYQDQPKSAHSVMEIGQDGWRSPEDQRVLDLLAQPRYRA